MNKKLNTVFFILGATVVNMIILVLIFILGSLLVSNFFLTEDTAPQIVQVIFLVLMGVAIAGSFFIYHRIIKLISAKVDMDKYFHPIIKPRKR